MRVVVAALLLVLLTAHGATSNEASAHTGRYYVTANPGLNLRAGPGGSYEILDQLPTNRIVKARGHRSGWMYLTDLTTGRTGWAALAYLKSYTPPPASAPTSGGGYCMTNYWGEWVCAPPWIADAIRGAAARWGVGTWWLFALAACESSFNPYAYNPISGVSGLFQFEPSTFYWQGGSSLWSVYEQSNIAAKMMATGYASHFHCLQLLGYV